MIHQAIDTADVLDVTADQDTAKQQEDEDLASMYKRQLK